MIKPNSIIMISVSLMYWLIATHLSAQLSALPVEHIWSKKTEKGWKIVASEKFGYDDQSRITKQIGTNPQNGDRHVKLYTYLNDTARIEIDSEYVEGKMTTYQDSILMHSNGVEISYGLDETSQSSSKWILSLKRTIVEDSAHHVVMDTYERYRDGNWDLEDRMLYFFEGDLCKEEFFQIREDDDWVTHQKSTHRYNKEGKLTITEVFSQNKTALIPEVMMSSPGLRIVYTYDKNGNLLERISKSFVRGKWVDDFKRTCIYQLNKSKSNLS